jgi:hypothetical protein
MRGGVYATGAERELTLKITTYNKYYYIKMLKMY